MKLTQLEQETIILYNQAESTAEIYTHDPKLLNKLTKMAEKHPDTVFQKDGRRFVVPKKCVSIREPYDEQRRAAARERALAGGYKPPKRGTSAQTE